MTMRKKISTIVLSILFCLTIFGFIAGENKNAPLKNERSESLIESNNKTSDIKEVSEKSMTNNSWSSWSVMNTPVYSGPHKLVGDPSVIKDGALFRMVYNCFDITKKWGAICINTSEDGIHWKTIDTGDSKIPGRVITTREIPNWDTAHETPLLLRHNNEYLLYFTGYVHKGNFGTSFPYSIGLAKSTDGVHFRRVGDDPVIRPTKNWYDNDAVFSPSIVEYDGKLVMVYTGYCVTDCGDKAGVHILAATSIDGVIWNKENNPIIRKEDFPEAKDGIAEVALVNGNDDYYYLFYSLLLAKGQEIGVARSKTPFGPWEINRTPIVTMADTKFTKKGVLSPSVILKDGVAHMWFHGTTGSNLSIGYATSSLPLYGSK